MKKLLSILFLLGLAGGLYAQFIPGVVASSKMVEEEDELLKYTDNFNSYTNGGLSGQGYWNVVGEVDITVDNGTIQQRLPEESNTTTTKLYYNRPLENDQYAQLEILTDPLIDDDEVINSIGVGVRMNLSGYGYFFMVSHEDMVLMKYDSPYSTNLGSSSSFVEAGDVIKLEAIGTSIKAYVNSQEVFSVTDSDLSSGMSGLSGWAGYRYPPFITADNWEAGDL